MKKELNIHFSKGHRQHHIKKMLLVLILMCGLIIASPALAEDNVYTVIGVKTWYCSWDLGGSYKSQQSFLMGPSLKIAKDNFFCGVTYLISLNDYEFDKSVSVSRSDLDLMMGYMLHPRIGLVTGYKAIETKIDSNNTNIANQNYTSPVFGVTTNYPISLGSLDFILTANLNYLPVSIMHYNKQEKKSTDWGDNNNGYSGEAGIAFMIGDNIAINTGLKYQLFKWINGSNDKFKGITLSLDYRF
ncbi:MAG: outer membrane beta-barrel protein [Desulfobacterales bacterium]|nr:outer membrane beta-barrel protein [Desulfobacterales bacterium]